MFPYGARFHFIGLFCSKALTIKMEKTSKKLIGSYYKMRKVKNYCLVNIYFYLSLLKNKKIG